MLTFPWSKIPSFVTHRLCDLRDGLSSYSQFRPALNLSVDSRGGGWPQLVLDSSVPVVSSGDHRSRYNSNPRRFSRCGRSQVVGVLIFKLMLLWRDPEFIDWELLVGIEIESREFQLSGIALSSRYISSPTLPVLADDFVPTRQTRFGRLKENNPFKMRIGRSTNPCGYA